MQQPTLTSYFPKTKKRPLQSPEEKIKLKQLAVESNRVQFVKKGNLSPVKVSPVKTKAQEKADFARLKAVARNFKDSQSKLEKLRQQRKQFEEESAKLIQKQPDSPRKRLFLESHLQKNKEDNIKEKTGVAVSRKEDKEVVVESKSKAKQDDNKESIPIPISCSLPVSESKSEATSTPSTSISEPLDITATPSLNLPFRFQIFKLLNDSMNNIASMYQRRSEVLTFKKLKPAVESTTNHTFSLKSVARMLTITDYFNVSIQKIDKVNQYVFEFQVDLLPSQLVRLKKNFHNKLIEFCLQEHDKFLKSQNIEVEPTRVTRWHPSFPIDVLQIPAKKLPELEEKLSSVSEVLNQVRDMVRGKDVPASSLKITSNPAPKKTVSMKELKGISASLLEKVREREKNRIVRDLTVPPEQLELRKIKGRLPELTRIIHNIFIGEKKAAIELPLFLERLHFSYGKLSSSSEIETHLDYLLKHYPAWIQKIKSTSNDYIKINKQVKISELTF